MNRHSTVVTRRPCAHHAALATLFLGLLPASGLAAEPESAPVESAAVESAPVEPPTLTLEQALERLDAQNLTLAQARARASEARGLVRQAMAAFLPTLGVSGSYLRNSESATLALGSILDAIEGGLATISPKPVHLDRSQVPAATVIQPLESFSAMASVRIPVFAAHAYPDALAASEAAKATEASARAVRLQLRATLLQAAWWSGAAEEMAAAAERALAVAQEHERSASRAVEAGTAAPLARLQAQTDAVRRESDLTRARAERQRAWLSLGVLLGEATPMRLQLPDEPSAPAGSLETRSLEARNAAALERRPELEAFASSLRAAQWQLDSGGGGWRRSSR